MKKTKAGRPQEHGDHMAGMEAAARSGDTDTARRLEEDHRRVVGTHHARGLKRSAEHERMVDPAAARDHQSAATERTHEAKAKQGRRGTPAALSWPRLLGEGT